MTYTIDQVVKVFRWNSAGYGRVLDLDNPDPVGTHTIAVVQKDGAIHACCVEPKDLKPGTKNDEKKMIAAEKERDRRMEEQDAQNERMQIFLQRLAEEPAGPLLDMEATNLGTLFFGHDLPESEQEMQSLRLMDQMSRSAGMTSGYQGCKRIHYTPGERVRPRTGMSETLSVRFKLYPDMIGTIAPSGDSFVEAIMEAVQFSPMQPAGVRVIWDGQEGINLVYVTEIELA